MALAFGRYASIIAVWWSQITIDSLRRMKQPGEQVQLVRKAPQASSKSIESVNKARTRHDRDRNRERSSSEKADLRRYDPLGSVASLDKADLALQP